MAEKLQVARYTVSVPKYITDGFKSPEDIPDDKKTDYITPGAENTGSDGAVLVEAGVVPQTAVGEYPESGIKEMCRKAGYSFWYETEPYFVVRKDVYALDMPEEDYSMTDIQKLEFFNRMTPKGMEMAVKVGEVEFLGTETETLKWTNSEN